ncbi:MAG: hypothetical protein GC168_11535 [Candidatus Hydrogenedens sp.]|nr:hypothetical protein [Candidatus Hydrogenedens sp.]
MYTSPSSLILGFHGCDREVAERILRGEITHLDKSENQYDWLGHGIYFWEDNPDRALQFAQELNAMPRPSKPRIRNPFILGAIIDLGHCLNLLETRSLRLVSEAHDHLSSISAEAGYPLPENKRDPGTGELLRRELDCAVIETLHDLNESAPYDSVRGVFQEGEELYPNAGFRAKNHIQICVRNTASIKGYFRLLPENE